MTFSVVARCSDTGMFGIAIASSSPAVAARCAFARAGVGAVATQNVTDPSLGPRMLDLMERGSSAPEAMSSIVTGTAFADHRQLLAVDRAGRTALHSGAYTLGIGALAHVPGAAAAGNLLSHERVPCVMLDAFAAATGHLGARLLAALRGARGSGGEAGPVHSAGLLLVREVSWPIVDLRVDWHEQDPISALESLWVRFEPQIEDYVRRALDPRRAPSFSVPGAPR